MASGSGDWGVRPITAILTSPQESCELTNQMAPTWVTTLAWGGLSKHGKAVRCLLDWISFAFCHVIPHAICHARFATICTASDMQHWHNDNGKYLGRSMPTSTNIAIHGNQKKLVCTPLPITSDVCVNHRGRVRGPLGPKACRLRSRSVKKRSCVPVVEGGWGLLRGPPGGPAGDSGGTAGG